MKKRGINRISLYKKSQTREIYHILIQVSIAIAIFWILQSYINSVEEDTMFEKSYLSKDLALLTEAIYSAPGNVEYNYSNDKADLSRYSLNFGEQRITILETGEQKEIKSFFPYGEDQYLYLEARNFYGVHEIHYSKNQDKLEIK